MDTESDNSIDESKEQLQELWELLKKGSRLLCNKQI